MSKYGNSAHPLEDELIEKCKEESKIWRDPSCFMGGVGFGSSIMSKLSIEVYKSRLKERVKKRLIEYKYNEWIHYQRLEELRLVLDLIDSTE